MDKRLDSVPTKSKVSEGYHIDNELDHARLLTYTSQRRLCRKGWQPKMAEINLSIPSLLESTVDRVPVVLLLDRLTAHANGNRRASRRGRGTTTTITTTSTSRKLKNWRTKSIEQASYETKRDAI
jgi:hypothetical protein